MEWSAGILYTCLHEAPESHDMLLAATSNPLETLWNAIGTGSCATQTFITGVNISGHESSLKHRTSLANEYILVGRKLQARNRHLLQDNRHGMMHGKLF